MRSIKKEVSAEDIKRLRLELGLSQNELAQKLRIAPSCIYRWESGRARPSRMSLERLNRFFARAEREEKQRGGQ